MKKIFLNTAILIFSIGFIFPSVASAAPVFEFCYKQIGVYGETCKQLADSASCVKAQTDIQATRSGNTFLYTVSRTCPATATQPVTPTGPAAPTAYGVTTEPLRAATEPSTDILNIIVDMTIKTSVLVGLMFFALKTTKKLSGEIGGAVSKAIVGNAIRGAGMAAGGAAAIRRLTTGRNATNELKKNGASLRSDILAGKKEGATEAEKLRGQDAQKKHEKLTKQSKASFDLRDNKTAQNVAKFTGLGLIAGEVGAKVGTAQKGGYAAAVAKKKEKVDSANTELAKFLREGENERLEEAQSNLNEQGAKLKEAKLRVEEAVAAKAKAEKELKESGPHADAMRKRDEAKAKVENKEALGGSATGEDYKDLAHAEAEVATAQADITKSMASFDQNIHEAEIALPDAERAAVAAQTRVNNATKTRNENREATARVMEDRGDKKAAAAARQGKGVPGGKYSAKDIEKLFEKLTSEETAPKTP